MIKELKRHKGSVELTKQVRRALKKNYRHELFKRSALLKIAAAWVITVPVSGFLAAILLILAFGFWISPDFKTLLINLSSDCARKSTWFMHKERRESARSRN